MKLVTAFVGSSVTFTCDTTLKTFNLVEWRRNDSANAIFLHYNNHPTVFDRRLSSRASITDKKNLRISNLKLGDQDVYFCKVVNSNTGGSESGSPIKLIVLGEYKPFNLHFGCKNDSFYFLSSLSILLFYFIRKTVSQHWSQKLKCIKAT